MTFAWKTQSTFFFSFLILFFSAKFAGRYIGRHAGGKNSLAIFHHHFRRKFQHTHRIGGDGRFVTNNRRDAEDGPHFLLILFLPENKMSGMCYFSERSPLVQTNLTQIDDSCRRNCWEKKRIFKISQYSRKLFFFCFFFPQMECLINSRGGPPVGDNNAGGSDLEHVSVRCCWYCCWYCCAVHFQEIQSLYLFCISLRSRGFIFGISTHTHTHTEWIDYVATYWP